MDGLSPEQRETFLKLKHQFASAHAAPAEPEPPPPTPPTVPRVFKSTEWYGIKPSGASNAEVRVMMATLVERLSPEGLEAWMSEAKHDADRMAQLG